MESLDVSSPLASGAVRRSKKSGASLNPMSRRSHGVNRGVNFCPVGPAFVPGNMVHHRI